MITDIYDVTAFDDGVDFIGGDVTIIEELFSLVEFVLKGFLIECLSRTILYPDLNFYSGLTSSFNMVEKCV